MIRHVAFLRAINVAGQKLIRMEELARIFSAAGFRNVRTYIQTGNVIFDSASTNSAALTKRIEQTLQRALGYEVTVMLRRLADIEEIVKRDPFRETKADALYVVFLADEPRSKPKLPLISTTEGLEVFEVKDRAAFILVRRKKNGSFGYPNKFVEKELGVLATTRNITTVRKIVDFANANPQSRRETRKKSNQPLR